MQAMSIVKGKLHRLKQRKTNPLKADEESLGMWKLENFELVNFQSSLPHSVCGVWL